MRVGSARDRRLMFIIPAVVSRPAYKSLFIWAEGGAEGRAVRHGSVHCSVFHARTASGAYRVVVLFALCFLVFSRHHVAASATFVVVLAASVS